MLQAQGKPTKTRAFAVRVRRHATTALPKPRALAASPRCSSPLYSRAASLPPTAPLLHGQIRRRPFAQVRSHLVTCCSSLALLHAAACPVACTACTNATWCFACNGAYFLSHGVCLGAASCPSGTWANIAASACSSCQATAGCPTCTSRNVVDSAPLPDCSCRNELSQLQCGHFPNKRWRVCDSRRLPFRVNRCVLLLLTPDRMLQHCC